MSTPSLYFDAVRERDYIRALAFELLMSDEVPRIDGPHASRLADEVLMITENEAREALQEMEANRTAAE